MLYRNCGAKLPKKVVLASIQLNVHKVVMNTGRKTTTVILEKFTSQNFQFKIQPKNFRL